MRSIADIRPLRGLLIASLLLGCGSQACFAQAVPSQACGRNYGRQQGLDLEKILSGDGPVSNMWGRENMRLAAETVLQVGYPRGSVNPGAEGRPVGGAGFKFALARGVTEACLTYSVRFPPDFEFAKGGKLPGLYGGDAPRGCAATKGFSARLMWRAGGAGELYLYHPAQTAACGESIGRGSWTFARGAWVSIAEQVIVNTPGQADGTIMLWIDGRLAVEARNLVLRGAADSAVDGLLFSTFFGGRDPSWDSPKDQTAEFKDFSLRF